MDRVAHKGGDRRHDKQHNDYGCLSGLISCCLGACQSISAMVGYPSPLIMCYLPADRYHDADYGYGNYWLEFDDELQMQTSKLHKG